MKNRASSVSILIPCFNSAEYLSDTLASCLDQSYDNIEIIVVDDGSTDDSLAIAKQYEKKHSSIKVYSQANKGAPAARNLAFSHAAGEYIQYLDADDILDKEKLSVQMASLDNEDTQSVVFGPCKMFEHSIEEGVLYQSSVNQNYDDPQKFLLDLWGSASMVVPHSWLVHRELIEQAGPWDESLLKNQDGAFFSKVVYHAKKVIYEDKGLVFYRTHNQNSVSRKKSYRSEASRLKSYDTYRNLFADRLEESEVRRALAIVYSYFIFDNYPLNRDLVAKAQQQIEEFGYKKPINVNIRLYKLLSPILGIYGAIKLHKRLSAFKSRLKAFGKKL